MSNADSSHPDPAVVPQEPSEVEKKAVEPVQPAQSPALTKLPGTVSTTFSKADALLLRLSKLLKTTAGLGASLSTLNYSIYLAAYLHSVSPTRAAVIAYISRLVGRTPSKAALAVPASAALPTFLTPLGAMISDLRTTLRLTGLLPLYIWLKTLLSKKTSKDMDPALHRIALLQVAGYIGFQLTENLYHLAGKGVIPVSIMEKRGGVAKWVAWSCRAWLVGVASDFLRLWREAEIEKSKTKTQQEKEDFDRKWWNEFLTAAYWLPVALEYSNYPAGVGLNQGAIGFLGLMAGLNNFRNAWAATA
ncbi:hypothetical protein PV10_05082 [Exophiala mesophila]|uniref:Uncharacterized protein n=1 Tax=Exophiala mesophila TaxID=212818 RepID=A0A0D1ZGU5_EXOME|nr:uncharacterized protein PV10_05082 [Exophiala mesophila]KIV93907.1 hypothetical protein PV10_05082 [Exophiala mesophila]